MSGFTFFLFVYRTKELFEVHPMNLIMYSILAESIGMICFAMQSKICDYKLYEIFAKTVFFSDDLQ